MRSAAKWATGITKFINEIAQRNLKEKQKAAKKNIRKHPNIAIVDDNAKLNYERKGAKYIQMHANYKEEKEQSKNKIIEI